MNAVPAIELRAEAALRDIIGNALDALASDPGALYEPHVLAELRAIRASDPAQFARVRAVVKASKTVATAEFDRLTTLATEIDGPAMFPDVEPWADPVDGAALLRDIVAAIRKHVIADLPTIYAATLWAVHTHLIEVVEVSPIANITAPEMRCGKTILLTILGKLTYRPLQVSNIAPAALFRAIEAWRPTLLIDEFDSFLAEHEAARGILNSGFTRESAFVVRCVGDEHTPTRFSTWGAKALCGIGKIADTLADRSIPLRLRRKTADETVANVRHTDPRTWENLRARIARWCEDHRDRIARARPAPVDGLNDRANDCWEPLLAVADEVGAEWPRHARTAAAILHGLATDAPSIGAQLLADIRAAFNGAEKLYTTTLLEALIANAESPWPTWNRGRPITARQLGARLGEFGIRPGTIRIGSQTGKGYTQEAFADAFRRYLPADSPVASVTPSQRRLGAGSSEPLSVTSRPSVTDERGRKLNAVAGCDAVTDRAPAWGGWEGEL